MIDYAGASGHLLKRALEARASINEDKSVADLNLPAWGWVLIAVDAIVFLPAIIFIGYTLGTIYPVLAMVENPTPPTYDPVPLNDEGEDGAALAAPERPWRPITSSIRAINRLLYSVAGWKANFRGASCAIVVAMLTNLIAGFFSAIPFVPMFVGTLVASLLLVQLSAAWVHIVISAPSSAPFYRRLPPFRKTLQATVLPVLAFWVATTLNQVVPQLIGQALGLKMWDPKHPDEVPHNEPRSAAWKGLIIVLVVIVNSVFLLIPAHVALVRVQASLLPPEDDTIVPFDRSFDGKVEPAIVGGKGYVSIQDALKTFDRASWKRLYLLYLKTFLVAVAIDIVICAVVIPEVLIFSKYNKKA